MNNVMSKKEFADAMVEAMEKILGGVAKISVQEVQKVNDTTLTGIVIREEGSNIAPCIYIEDAYESYLNGKPDGELIDGLFLAYDKHKKSVEKNVDMNYIFEEAYLIANSKIKLLSTEANAEYLKDKVTRQIADLSEVLMVGVDIPTAGEGEATVVLTKSHVESFGFSEEFINRLFEEAEGRIRPVVKSIQTVLGLSAPDEDNLSLEGDNFVVVTNESKVNGAAILASKEAMDEVVEKIGTDEFYIIPSSIHEFLIVGKDLESSDLLTVIREVNTTQVAADEVLSYNLYGYSHTEGLYMTAFEMAA